MSKEKNAHLVPFKNPSKLAKALAKLTAQWKGSADELLDAQLAVIARRSPRPLSRELRCRACGTKAAHSRRHDADYCRSCNLWLDGCCLEDGCHWCTGRPSKPLVAPTTQPPSDFGTLELPKDIQRAIVKRCNHVLATPRQSNGDPSPESERLMDPIIGALLHGLCSTNVAKKVTRASNRMTPGIRFFTAPPVVMHDRNRGISKADRKWLKSIPLNNRPSIPILHHTLRLAGFKVQRMERYLLGFSENEPTTEHHQTADESRSTKQVGELIIYLYSKQGTLNDTEVRIRAVSALRLAGFDTCFNFLAVGAVNRCWQVFCPYPEGTIEA